MYKAHVLERLCSYDNGLIYGGTIRSGSCSPIVYSNMIVLQVTSFKAKLHFQLLHLPARPQSTETN